MKLSEDTKQRIRSILSRKVLAWVVATVLVFMKVISGEHWFYITLAYLGVNIVGKFAGALNNKFKNGKGSPGEP